MREYTIQFLEGQDWVRIGAVYDGFEALERVTNHASDLLHNGAVVRILGRTLSLRGQALPWHTIRLNSDNRIELDKPVYGCPS